MKLAFKVLLTMALCAAFSYVLLRYLQHSPLFLQHQYFIAAALSGGGILTCLAARAVLQRDAATGEPIAGHTANIMRPRFFSTTWAGCVFILFGLIVALASPACGQRIRAATRGINLSEELSKFHMPKLAGLGKGKAKAKTPPLRVQGIFYSEKRPSAVINGETLYVGDAIRGARVVSISRDHVTLEQAGKELILACGN